MSDVNKRVQNIEQRLNALETALVELAIRLSTVVGTSTVQSIADKINWEPEGRHGD